MERPKGVNWIYSAGGGPLCTLHRAEGLCGRVHHIFEIENVHWLVVRKNG